MRPLFAILAYLGVAEGQILFHCYWEDERGEPESYVCHTDFQGSFLHHVAPGISTTSIDISSDWKSVVWVERVTEMRTPSWLLQARTFGDLDKPWQSVYPDRSFWEIRSLAWSPAKDDLIAFFFEGEGIRVINLEGETQYIISADELGGIEATDIDWAPGGQFVFSSIESDEIWITDGARSRFLSKGRFPKVSPDGRKIAFIVGWEPFSRRDTGYERSVWIMGLDGSNKQPIHKWTYGSIEAAWGPDSREIVFGEGSKEFETSIKAVSLNGATRTILDVTPYGVLSMESTVPWDLETSVSPVKLGRGETALRPPVSVSLNVYRGGGCRSLR